LARVVGSIQNLEFGNADCHGTFSTFSTEIFKKGEVKKLSRVWKTFGLVELEPGMRTGTQRIKTIFDFLLKNLSMTAGAGNFHKKFSQNLRETFSFGVFI
jgi:hypothetical protein